jgi:hypothetical protein
VIPLVRAGRLDRGHAGARLRVEARVAVRRLHRLSTSLRGRLPSVAALARRVCSQSSQLRSAPICFSLNGPPGCRLVHPLPTTSPGVGLPPYDERLVTSKGGGHVSRLAVPLSLCRSAQWLGSARTRG